METKPVAMEHVNILDALPSRIFSFYSEARQLLEKRMPLPRMAILHANYTCNHHCPGCDFREFNEFAPVTMTRDQAYILASEIIDLQIRAVEFAGGGEPTIDPNLDLLIDRFKEHGIAMGILTNGSMLRGELLEKIVRYFNYLRVSLDAGTGETYRKMRGLDNPREFDRVLENVCAAVSLRNSLGRNMNINLKFTVSRDNCHEMEDAVRLAIECGVDSIQFSPFSNVAGKLSDDAIEEAAKKLADLRGRYDKQIRILGSLYRTSIKTKCWLNPIFTVIDAFGDVYTCTYYRHRKGRHCLGNIFKRKLQEIWLSERHFEIMRNIVPDECNLYNCRFHRYNELFNALLVERNNELDFI